MFKHLMPDEEPEYVGNVFGWRTSLLGLVVIGGLGLLAIYRYYTLDEPVKSEVTEEEMFTPYMYRLTPRPEDTTAAEVPASPETPPRQ